MPIDLADSDAGSQLAHRPAGWPVPPRSRASPMMFRLWMIQTFLSFLILLDQAIAQTLVNITVDDNDPVILYVGNWESDANHPSQFDYGGSHTVSGDATASATFPFTGVAVYYLAPKWPYAVDSYVSLDGGTPALVDMTGPAQTGEEDVQWAPLWSATGLSNGPHSVLVTRGAQYAVVDGFIYTTQSADITTNSQLVSTVVSTTTVETNEGTSSTTSGAAASSTSSNAADSQTNSTIIIAVTISAAVVCLILVIILIVFRMRRKRKTDSTALGPADGETAYIYTPHGHQEANTHSTYSGMAYSDPTTTGSASGAGLLSAQQQMSYANVQPYGHDAYRPSSMLNQSLAFPAVGATHNTGGSGNGYNVPVPVTGRGYYGENSSGHNIAAAYAGIGSSAVVAPPSRPPSFLSESAGFEGSYPPHAGGPNTADAAYPGYAASRSGVAAATIAPQELQHPPVPEKARYNPLRAGASKNAQPYNAAGPISPPESPPSYADEPEASSSRPNPSSLPRPNKQGFI